MMNNLLIPGILLAVIMIAGGLALTPTQQVSTVDDFIIENIKIIVCDADDPSQFYNSTSDACEGGGE